MEINVNNITLNYLVKGNGNPLILLHGNGEDLKIFDKLVSKLENQFTIYAIDSRNHGGSTRTEDFTYETMAEDIHQFIEKLELKHVSVIGFSDGAIISLLLTLKYPQTFNRMVLLGVNLKPTDFKLDIYNSIAEEYEKTQDPLFKMMLEQPNIELDDLKEINTPTLVIGAEDDLYYEDSFQNIVNTMPNAVLKIIKGHDHGSYVVNNDVLYPYVVEFLQ
ncbi:alpha/beta hydrolase [Dysgonomonas sp. HDW5B]|uniref:alpha/beta fold hydrolase n=1 Tax=Dysgonomonas sp. HDW5B TaxID=2714927 RepID=UPI0014099121|nr:alpha/beta hydrolase [Dysgonomonas sp. HDW5B]QIK54403.1 alpha/beta hydrolase [Dysgonomonas sp. HDW5B]